MPLDTPAPPELVEDGALLPPLPGCAAAFIVRTTNGSLSCHFTRAVNAQTSADVLVREADHTVVAVRSHYQDVVPQIARAYANWAVGGQP